MCQLTAVDGPHPWVDGDVLWLLLPVEHALCERGGRLVGVMQAVVPRACRRRGGR